MKKRLRKKFHKGEFAEFGFEIDFYYPALSDTDEASRFWEEYIDMIEETGLECGGGGAEHQSYFITKSGRGSVTEQQREAVIAWLEHHPDVCNVVAGELRDAWYGWK